MSKHLKIKLFEQFIEEMAISDQAVQRILKYMETLGDDSEELARCKEIITGNSSSSMKRVIEDFLEMDYSDSRQIEREIFGSNQ